MPIKRQGVQPPGTPSGIEAINQDEIEASARCGHVAEAVVHLDIEMGGFLRHAEELPGVQYHLGIDFDHIESCFGTKTSQEARD